MGNPVSIVIGFALLGATTVQAASLETAASGTAAVQASNEHGGLALVGERAGTGDWIVEEADNVCGLKDARQLRSPAVVDYEVLIAATAESKEMKRKGIDKDSPEGQVLFNKAVDRVRNAASDHMKAKGYDSVWKEIKHRRGLKAPDATDEVKKLVEQTSGGGPAGR